MGEWTRQPAVKAGIEKAVAGKTIGIAPDFLHHQAPADNVQAFGDAIGKIWDVGRELFGFGRDRSEANQRGKIISGTPGRGQFA